MLKTSKIQVTLNEHHILPVRMRFSSYRPLPVTTQITAYWPQDYRQFIKLLVFKAGQNTCGWLRDSES